MIKTNDELIEICMEVASQLNEVDVNQVGREIHIPSSAIADFTPIPSTMCGIKVVIV